eukprot:gnl/Spiro4/8576_TR4494_c0_g1_i1.p1 gnl/Spiro4/8576_TR4494_c0_g1~~gnl/Spiro4/8576_TR4494_c0_g1_i1.p1  ORF type:complete len:672 (+),score=193.13 gnl/Spiro4/8576_TR4494_c0_g1_i1:51-2018(+)
MASRQKSCCNCKCACNCHLLAKTTQTFSFALRCVYCSAPQTAETIRAHESACADAPFTCKYDGRICKRTEIEGHQEKCQDKCAFCKKGVCIDEMRVHVTTCEFRPTKCAWAGCGAEFPFNAIIKHQNSCPFLLTCCCFCEAKIPQKDMDAHVEACPEKPHACKFCKRFYSASTIAKHEGSECPFAKAPCQYCNEEVIVKFHRNVCPKKPVPCVNCGAQVLQEKYAEHVSCSCPKRPARCHNRGCGQLVPVSEISKHLEACPYRRQLCLCCNTDLAGSEFDHHMTSCPERLLECGNQGCNKQFPARVFEDHTRQCPFRIEACEFCRKKFQSSQLQAHVAECECRPVKCRWCIRKLPFHSIEDHQVVCPMRAEPCKWCKGEFPFEQLAFHFTSCPARPSACKYCKKEFPFNGVPAHEAACDMRPEPCKYCKTQFAVKDLDAHFNVCPQKPAQCSLCKKMKKQTNIQKHETRCKSIRACRSCGDEFTFFALKTHEPPCLKLRQSLMDKCKSYLPFKPVLGITIDKKGDMEQEHPNGIDVKGVRPGYSFDRAGIIVGDEVKKINGNSCLTNNQFEHFAREIPANVTINVTVCRQGTDVDIPVFILGEGYEPEQMATIVRFAEGNITKADLEAFKHDPHMFDPRTNTVAYKGSPINRKIR